MYLRNFSSLDSNNDLTKSYISSQSYQVTSSNFPPVQSWGDCKVYSYNETSIEAICTYQQPPTATYQSYYIGCFIAYDYTHFNTFYCEVNGDTKNQVTFTGNFKMFNAAGEKIITLEYVNGEVTNIEANPYLVNNAPGFGGCVNKTIGLLAGRWYTALGCLAFGVECAAAIVIHCTASTVAGALSPAN